MLSPNNYEGEGCYGKSRRWCIRHSGILIFLLSFLFLIVGVTLLIISSNSYDGYEIVKDYTDCTPKKIDSKQTKCKDDPGNECTCFIPISITQPMEGPVTVFYEWDSYEQAISSYSQSRDDNQLAGHLSLTPADSCGQYTYANTSQGRMPIAPCGQLADAMFNDTFSLITKNDFVPVLRTGLLSEDDKKQFRNPSGNLSEAFKSFSKPINWQRNVWELNMENPDNNGFQYEAFIIWMKTDLKRKPAFHVKDGLPVGNYALRVKYRYPTSRYDGRRKCIISSVRQVVNILELSLEAIFVFICFAGCIQGILIVIMKTERYSAFQRVRRNNVDNKSSTRSFLHSLVNSSWRHWRTKEGVEGAAPSAPSTPEGAEGAAHPGPPDLEGTQMPPTKEEGSSFKQGSLSDARQL